jgi:hypothetical protein
MRILNHGRLPTIVIVPRTISLPLNIFSSLLPIYKRSNEVLVSPRRRSGLGYTLTISFE